MQYNFIGQVRLLRFCHSRKGWPMKLRYSLLFVVIVFTTLFCACGGGSAPPTGGASSGPSGSGGIPQGAHVFVLVEENHGYSDVIGNANMPYLNSLVSAYGLATQYFADAHPSLPNYFELTAGASTAITGTQGDGYSG